MSAALGVQQGARVFQQPWNQSVIDWHVLAQALLQAQLQRTKLSADDLHSHLGPSIGLGFVCCWALGLHVLECFPFF